MAEPTILPAHPANDPAHCGCHPHCTFCGGVQVDEGDRVVCVSCGTEAPVESRKSAEVAS